MQASLEGGKPGQFDVVLDGAVIASRSGGLLTRLVGGGWPDESAVIDAIARRQAG